MQNYKRDVLRSQQSVVVATTKEAVPDAEALVMEIFRQQLQLAVETSIRSVDLRTRLAHRKIGRAGERRAQITSHVADSLERAARLCAEQWLLSIPADQQSDIAHRLAAAPPVLPMLALVATKSALPVEPAKLGVIDQPAPIAAEPLMIAPVAIAEPVAEPVVMQLATLIADTVGEAGTAEVQAAAQVELAAKGDEAKGDEAKGEEAQGDEAKGDEIVALTDLETNVEPLTDAAVAEEVADFARTTKPAGAPVSLIEMLATGFDEPASEPAPIDVSDLETSVVPMAKPELAAAKVLEAKKVEAKKVEAKKADTNSSAVAADASKQQSKPVRRRFGFLRSA